MRAPRILIVIPLLVGLYEANAGVLSPNDYVRLEVRSVPGTMRPGSNGIIELRFLPAHGIHINIDPPVSFSLDSTDGLNLKGKTVMTADSGTGYLLTSVPVTQAVTLDREIAPGRRTMRGTVTYFYCSDAEGWCNRQKEPAEFTILVIP